MSAWAAFWAGVAVGAIALLLASLLVVGLLWAGRRRAPREDELWPGPDRRDGEM